jgi:1-acyl-sn-glycerol-3-phosphate acyltransferase
MLYKFWSLLYHGWYYVVVVISILLIFPFIYFTSKKEDQYNHFFWWSRVWAKMVLIGMGCWWVVKRQGRLDPNKTYIIIANHSSELDIMLTLALVRNCFVFIGKAELARAPLFGYFYKRTNILVDRSSLASKRDVLKKAANRIDEGTGICIFPEGGIPEPHHLLAPFKSGAFRLAIEKQIPILPISFPDNKRHFAELWDGGYPGRLRATIHAVIDTNGLSIEHADDLQDQCYRIIHDELRNYGCEGKTIYAEEKASFA